VFRTRCCVSGSRRYCLRGRLQGAGSLAVGRPARSGDLRAEDRYYLEPGVGRRDRVFRSDVLAASAGLDRSRCVPGPARTAAHRAALGRATRPGPHGSRRLARARPQRGDHIGPSPVNRGHPGSKHHLIVDGHGVPLAVTLTGGNRHDVTQLMPMLDTLPPIRGRRRRPRRKPRELSADAATTTTRTAGYYANAGSDRKIARRGVTHGSGLGKIRWLVERGYTLSRDYAPATNVAPTSTSAYSNSPAPFTSAAADAAQDHARS
jgi:hypothetical protein